MHNGRSYGPECIEKAGGFRRSGKKVIIKKPTEIDDIQMGLFDE